MNISICTVITPDWIDRHLVRWVRYIRTNVVPTASLYLILLESDGEKKEHGILSEFKGVARISVEMSRWAVNSLRMRACKIFGLSEVLYLDADSDVFSGLTDISGELKEEVELACVESPVVHPPLISVWEKLGWGIPEKAYNNGLIFLKKDFEDEYEAAWEKAFRTGAGSDRIMGTIAFNIMLRELSVGKWMSLPYEYGVIWWDAKKLLDAKVVQYCSDAGQRKRVELERGWRSVQ